jgi:hypothetical protein
MPGVILPVHTSGGKSAQYFSRIAGVNIIQLHLNGI